MDITQKDLQKALEILEILPPITYREIRESYKRLSKKYHPDLSQQESKKFLEINEAYKLLKEYIDNYRYFFDDDEVEKQYYNLKFKKQFETF